MPPNDPVLQGDMILPHVTPW